MLLRIVEAHTSILSNLVMHVPERPKPWPICIETNITIEEVAHLERLGFALRIVGAGLEEGK